MKIIMLFIATVFAVSVYSQSVFVVQNSTNSSVHQTFAAAIAAAVDGDYVYLPGGSFGIGDLKVTKRVHIFGAGHYPDSTQATGITALTGNIYFKTGASNSVIQGVYLSGNIFMGDSCSTGNVNNILISRCNVENIYLTYNTGSTNCGAENIFIKDCIIRTDIRGANVQGVVVETSIITNQISYFNGNADFKNNIFLRHNTSSTSYNYVLYYVSNCNFNNSIFRHYYATTNYFSSQSSNNFFNNCIFGMSTTYFNAGIQSNCLFSTSFSPLFVNVPSVTDFSYAYNYHLSDTSLAIGAGMNGTDCGIYGGDNPYKDGAVPLNPHIQFKQIPTATDSEGKLNIHVKVSAQEN